MMPHVLSISSILSYDRSIYLSIYLTMYLRTAKMARFGSYDQLV
jgi:hypothetical protein